MPNLRRIQYRGGGGGRVDKKPHRHFIDVQTDEGISSRCTTDMSAIYADALAHQVIGESPLARERLFQMLHKGTRWFHYKPGWFGDFDNCLWDIAGKAAGLPVHALVGRVRDKFPCYLTAGETDLEGYLAQIEEGRKIGISA